MKKRILALLLAALLLLSILAGCTDRNTPITAEQAQKIALEDAGLSAKDVSDVHTHVGSYQEIPCYSIHITVDGAEYEYVIAAEDGEILYSTDIR